MSDKTANGWRVANCVEQHFRMGGRIVGKIHRPAGEPYWTCYAYLKPRGPGHRRIVGWRKDAETAKALVEKSLLRAISK